jgi:two-component system invasion response regulator UvrY
MIRILLVDDHPVVRQGLRTALSERMKGAVVGEVGDVAAALGRIQHEAWDVVVADISLPGRSGLDLVKEVRRSHPGLPTLVVSMHPAAQFARRALGAGAAGYLTKDSPLEELIAAIEEVRRGRRYLGRDAADLLRWSSRSTILPHEALSDREYQILRLIGSGFTVSAIGKDLGLSVKTISTYRARVLAKLGMRTSAELMRYAIENGLVES